MSDSIAINDTVNEQEFPVAAPKRFFQKLKIPTWLYVTVGIVFGVFFLAATFPGNKKRAKEKSFDQYTSNMDSYEQQNPIETDRFNTEINNDPPKGSAPEYDNSAFATNAPQVGQDGTPGSNNDQNSPAQVSSARGTAIQMQPSGYKVSQRILDRMDATYQNMVQHFKSNKTGVIEPYEGKAYEELLKRDRLGIIESPLKNLTQNSELYTNKVEFTVPSGTRIRAVTQSEVNSDHPGFFTAKITSPMELSGYMLLCQSRGNARDRIPVTANKIIAPDGKTETQIPGEVQMRYAGLEGDVQSHAFQRIVPSITSALVGAGAGFLYFKALGGDKMNDETGRINTADQVVSAPYQKGVTGVQNEIDRFGGDYPNTVKVPQGTQFEILVTDQFTIELN